jgi:hypothetical protein
MKLFKKFAVAVILVSALALPTFAGELDTPGKTPPPPGSSTSTTTTCETDQTSTGGATSTTDESYQLVYDGFMAVLGLY